MARYILVPCLILTLLTSGCADRQEVRPDPDRELANAFAERPVEQVRQGTWWEEHPGVKKTITVAGVVVGVTVLVAVVLVGALAVGFALSHQGQGNMQ